MPAAGWTDERIERAVGRLLQAGVLAAAAVVLAGGAVYLARHGAEPADRRAFHGEPAALREPAGIAAAALSSGGRGLILLGLLLIATPVARVAFSVFAFARRRDALYVAVTLVVLAVLTYGLFGGGP